MKKKKENRGGKRIPGPGKKLGQPKKPDAKVAISGRVRPDVEAYLRAHGLSVTIEKHVRASKAFREWVEGQC